ncbi:MAG TPA: alkaline phosphatase family protein, partial [Candidatus Baltobacteraceae bacterium]|nr:alkaline phosphatase family protein [Candidatus Baltobacteraceae bacterium]
MKRQALFGLMLAALAGCGGSPNVPVAPVAAPQLQRSTASPIEHIVILIQENRSFDNLFATYPGADGAKNAKMSTGRTVALTKGPLQSYDIAHNHVTFETEYDHGKMDGFNLANVSIHGVVQQAGQYIYRYVDPKDIGPYWAIAHQYVLADHAFQTQSSGSFTAHQDLIRGSTHARPNAAVIDLPSHAPYGCDAPAGTTTSLLFKGGRLARGGGPFPCFGWQTLRDLLDAKGISWKYYVPQLSGHDGGPIWNAFDAVRAVRYGPEWSTNVSMPETNFFTDLNAGQLPAVSWLVPKV